MDRDDMKRRAAEAALAFVSTGTVIGIGAGTTTEHFIEVLAASAVLPRAAVAASRRSESLLLDAGLPVTALDEDRLPLDLYVDGADEADGRLRLIKGGGGALAREKVLASASRLFVCIVDESKLVAALGTFPLPVEVLPVALGYVTRELRLRGGEPVRRQGYLTDNGNCVVDVHGLDLSAPEEAELQIAAIPGVVESGIFARRKADVLLVGTGDGVRRLEAVEGWREHLPAPHERVGKFRAGC